MHNLYTNSFKKQWEKNLYRIIQQNLPFKIRIYSQNLDPMSIQQFNWHKLCIEIWTHLKDKMIKKIKNYYTYQQDERCFLVAQL